MERSNAYLIAILMPIFFTLGMLFCTFFMNSTNKEKLASCQEEYAKVLRFDDRMTKIEKLTFQYRIDELEDDLKKCRGQ